MRYDKLVRDNIPEVIESKGGKQESRIADDAEYESRLRDKIMEEIGELLEANDTESREGEMADVLEVLDAFIARYGLNKDNILSVKERKLKEKGGFTKKVILETSE